MDNLQLLSLLQLCDSNLPVGQFSHSYGLETYIQDGKVHDKQTMKEWLMVYAEDQMCFSDGLGCYLGFQALSEGHLTDFWEIAVRLDAQSLSRESREANRKVGMRLLKLCQDLYPNSILDMYKQKIKTDHIKAHPALVFAMISYELHLSETETIVAYLYSTISGLIQNAVRGIPIGQTAGQTLLHDMKSRIEILTDRIKKLSIDDLGATPPGLEIAQMRHEHLAVRIFMS
ncbi:urease accessory protein UreF [Terrilactibacillus laevilacticus]|uniref:Urease accessory protein UreF n=1 Tax=Terrilactibacillus laevilacticus TaxID=1380157 RepID=A0ABW5PMU5_9BACI|nr:urease accessory protein UreF [Terrilactibacillus laevilacticus]